MYCVYDYFSKPITVENTRIYYAIIENGKVQIEEPKKNMSMGCTTYWRIKGYPCYEIE